jgi:hypothetical protein
MPPQITELSLRKRKNENDPSQVYLSVDEYVDAVKKSRAK